MPGIPPTRRRLLIVSAVVVVIAGGLLGVATLTSQRNVLTSTTTTRSSSATAAKTFYVQISCGQVSVCTNGFYPKNLTVPAGSQVTWFSEEPPELYIYHNVVFRDGGIVSGQLNGGDEFTATFNSPGVFQYYDADFPGNQGVIVVIASK